MMVISTIKNYLQALIKDQVQDKLIMLFLLLVVIASGADLMADVSHGAEAGRVLQEAAVMVIALLGFCWMLISLIRSQNEIKQLYEELDSIKEMPQPSSQKMIDARRQLAEVIVM
jgi:hypothetical protein